MTAPFTYQEGSILVRLLMAHFIADFFLQSDKAVIDKQSRSLRSAHFWKHIFTVIITTALLLFNLHFWKQILVIGITHLLFDAGKIAAQKKYNKDGNTIIHLRLFIADQLLHVIIIVFMWLWIIAGWGRMQMLLTATLPDYRLLIKVLGYLIVTGPVSYLIRFLTDRWAVDLDKNDDGLQNAGMWIGFLERILILTLVFIQQYTAIGFLVAAKSILRLIDKPERTKDTSEEQIFSSRKHTEYVVIGTFLSFSFALFAGLVINSLLTH